MKIKEVTQNESEALYEALDAENDTGVATADLVKIVDAHKKNEWRRFNSSDDYFAYLDQLDADREKAAE